MANHADNIADDNRYVFHFLNDTCEIDALWIPNNNVLISSNTIQTAIFPFLKKNKMPIIVNVENLVTPRTPMGSLALISVMII